MKGLYQLNNLFSAIDLYVAEEEEIALEDAYDENSKKSYNLTDTRSELHDSMFHQLESVSSNINEEDVEINWEQEVTDIENKEPIETYGELEMYLHDNKFHIRGYDKSLEIGNQGFGKVGEVIGRLVFDYDLERAIDEVYASKRPAAERLSAFTDDKGMLPEHMREDFLELAEDKFLEPSNKWYKQRKLVSTDF